MRTRRRSAVVSLLLGTALALSIPVSLAVPARADSGPGCVLAITRFAFHPSQVHEGEWARLRLVARNCTNQTLHVSEVEYGLMLPPCPTIDPLGDQVDLAPHARYAPQPLRILAPPCDGEETMVVSFSDAHGTVVAHREATLTITP